MRVSKRRIRGVFLLLVLAATVLSPQLALPVAADEGGIDPSTVVSSPYDACKGVPYMKYEGRFLAAGVSYSVPFEILAPADPTRGNGAVLLDPIHSFGGQAGSHGYLTPEFLCSRGFSRAAVLWYPEGTDPFAGYDMTEALAILENFAIALREDPAAQEMLGDVQQVYGAGVSKTCEPMHALVHSTGNSVLDFTFLLVPEWAEETHEQPADSPPVMVLLTESDLVRGQALGIHTDALRGSSDTYRCYEVAGAPHVPDVPYIRELTEPMGMSSEGTTPLDWSPVARALFLAGHRWVTEGAAPPPSMALDQAPGGEIDPLYEERYGLALETGIARDANGNALGGIQMPDLAVGRGLFIAFDPPSFAGWGLYGDFDDLKCEPQADGSVRFGNHGAYVSAFTQQANSLVKAGGLLQEDASPMVSEAAQSDVGMPETCPPALLPVTGAARGG